MIDSQLHSTQTDLDNGLPPSFQQQGRIMGGMDSMNEMLAAVFFSSFGFGYFIYGKKQANFLMLATGILLMVYPYFVSGAVTIILGGVALMALPFAAARFS